MLTQALSRYFPVVLLAVFLTLPTGFAQTIYGAAFQGPGPATLYTIAPATGQTTLVAPLGLTAVSSLAFAPDGVSLYGVGLSGGKFVLLGISPQSGASTSMGLTGLAAPCQDMAFRSDGRLFCYSGGSIFTLSTSTGAATLVGSTGKFPLGNGLAFSVGNILYTANESELDSINQSTGAVTLVVPLTYSPAFGSAPRAAAMKFHPNGTLYAAVVTGNGGAASALGIINIATGAVSRVGPMTPGMDALAISAVPIFPLPTPAPSTWLLGIMGIAFIAFYQLRRRSLISDGNL